MEKEKYHTSFITYLQTAFLSFQNIYDCLKWPLNEPFFIIKCDILRAYVFIWASALKSTLSGLIPSALKTFSLLDVYVLFYVVPV